METSTLTYPVSTKYRQEWGEWETVREIVQNAIDSEGQVTVDYDGDTQELVISDDGEGFKLSDLLIGETNKDGETSIGKFGEGLKFALLVLSRLEKSVVIRSNKLMLKPRLDTLFDRKVLAIDYSEVEKTYFGTKVTIQNVSQDYRDHFISLDKEKCFESFAIKDSNNLYIKGILVKEVPSLAGYNLVIERENPLSGDVPSYTIADALYYLIRRTSDVWFIEHLLKEGTNSEKEECIEFDVGRWTSHKWSLDYPDLWKDAIEKIYGENTCLQSDAGLGATAAYHGYNVLKSRAGYMKGILPSDKEMLIARKDQEFKVLDEGEVKLLSVVHQDNLKIARALCKKFCTDAKVAAGIFTEKVTAGISRRSDRLIIIATDRLNFLRTTLKTLLHEMAHLNSGEEDATIQFLDKVQDLNIKVLIYLAMDRIKALAKPEEDEDEV